MAARTCNFRDSLIGLAAGRIYWCRSTRNRTQAPATIFFTSTKGPRRLSTPSGRSRYTGRIATKSRTASTASPSAVGCLSSTIRMVRLTSISRTRTPERTRRQTGFLRRRPCSTSPCAYTRQAGGAGRKVEPATGDGDPGAPGLTTQ
jgi:hypothetical protein